MKETPALGPFTHTWVNPELDLERKVHEAPEHVQASLRRATELSGPFEPRGSLASWEETVSAPPRDGTAVTNTVTETIMVPDFTLPADYMYGGRVLRYTLWGRVSTVVTTPGTITFRLRWGGVAGVVLVASKAQRPKTTVSTNMAGWVQFTAICRTPGTAGTFFAMGQNNLANTIGDAAASQESVWPDVPAVSASADTTTAKAISPTINFSVATATTSWTTHIALLEVLN